jgi:hypothetical protein
MHLEIKGVAVLALLHRIALGSPTPMPSPSSIDTSRVQPGIGGAVVFTFLLVALILLLISMNRHIKRVNFEESAD